MENEKNARRTFWLLIATLALTLTLTVAQTIRLDRASEEIEQMEIERDEARNYATDDGMILVYRYAE